MAYGFNSHGQTFTPDGDTPVTEAQSETDKANRETEAKEIEWLKTAPDKVFLYVKGVTARTHAYGSHWAGYGSITTWPGTVLDDCAAFGSACKFPAFGRPSVRRAVTCRIFGTRYVGW